MKIKNSQTRTQKANLGLCQGIHLDIGQWELGELQEGRCEDGILHFE